MLFNFYCLKSIIASRINSGRSENFLLYIKIIFRGTIKYKSLYFKINFTKVEPNTHLDIQILEWPLRKDFM